jgi:15-cis-phytoene synthase
MSHPHTDSWPDPDTLPPYDPAQCRQLMRGGSKTFFAASLLLPARVCAPARALYAFCRLADDEIDLGDDPQAALTGLARRLDAIYAGRPQAIDADRALASVVHRFRIPRELLDALLEGFVWDTAGRRYETLEDVHAYGARVAGTVGAMMALVMGARDSQSLARACDLGVAMQLTNIARDVGEDARNGRLYLPRQWLHEAGIDPDAWLAAPRFSDAVAGVIRRLLAEADRLYRQAEAGVATLPLDCRPAILAARWVYAEIGRELERRHHCNAVDHRAVVPKGRKLALIARATAAAWRSVPAAWPAAATLPAVQFLVDAAAVTAPPPMRAKTGGFDDRLGWVIALSERHAREQQPVLR